MPSREWQEILSYVSEKSKVLRADDPRFEREVILVHEDGSQFHWKHAFCETRDGFVLVFTEHHGCPVYRFDEVNSLSTFKPFHPNPDDTEDVLAPYRKDIARVSQDIVKEAIDKGII